MCRRGDILEHCHMIYKQLMRQANTKSMYICDVTLDNL